MSQYWQEEMWATDVVSGTDKMVALAMARRAGDDGLTYASAKTLSGDTGLSMNTVARSMKVVEEVGIVVRAAPEEYAHLGPVRSVVYRMVDPSDYPTVGQDYTSVGQDYPTVGYVWEPDAAPAPKKVIMTATPERGSTTPEWGSAAPTWGITSTSTNGDLQTPSPDGKKRPGNGTVTSRLMAQFMRELKIAVSENGGVALGPLKREALARTFGLLQKRDGLTEEQISSMISAYLAKPSAWNPSIHPWQDFASSGTLTRLRNQTKWRDDAPEYPGQPTALTEVMPVLTVEEILRRDLEKGPTWLRPKSS